MPQEIVAILHHSRRGREPKPARLEVEVEMREAVFDRRELALDRDVRAEGARAPLGRRVAVRELGEAVEAAPDPARGPPREQHAAVRVLDRSEEHTSELQSLR